MMKLMPTKQYLFVLNSKYFWKPPFWVTGMRICHVKVGRQGYLVVADGNIRRLL